MMKISLLPILLITGLNAQEFSASLNASGGDSNYDMTFGFHPAATDGERRNQEAPQYGKGAGESGCWPNRRGGISQQSAAPLASGSQRSCAANRRFCPDGPYWRG